MNLVDSNPYASPNAVSDASTAQRGFRRRGWLRVLLSLQCMVILASLAVEAYEHESIVGSGPVFSLTGLCLAVVAYRQRDWAAVGLGASAVGFALVIVFLINYNGWGPAQGDRPITLLAFGYALVALPVAWQLLFVRTEWEAEAGVTAR